VDDNLLLVGSDRFFRLKISMACFLDRHALGLSSNSLVVSGIAVALEFGTACEFIELMQSLTVHKIARAITVIGCDAKKEGRTTHSSGQHAEN